MGGTTTDAVREWLKLPAGVDDAILVDVVAATNTWCAKLPVVVALTDPTADWPPDVTQGTTMLAARLYRRRNTPSGVESFADNVVYVPRRDADVASLLHLAKPGLG